MNRPFPATIFALGLAVSPMAAAQEKAPPPSNAPSPAEKSPLSTTTVPDPAVKPGGGTAMPAPDKSLGPPSAPGAPPAGSGRPPTLQTLVPAEGDLGDVDEVSLPAKPAAILSGKTSKEEAVAELKASFKRIEDDLAKAGIKPAGRPLAVFTGDEEEVLHYEAMIPIASVPAQGAANGDGVRFGATPSGKGFRYRHSGSYDAIGNTYGILSTYLDVKDIVVQDLFIEEYLTDLTDGADETLEVNIFAMRK